MLSKRLALNSSNQDRAIRSRRAAPTGGSLARTEWRSASSEPSANVRPAAPNSTISAEAAVSARAAAPKVEPKTAEGQGGERRRRKPERRGRGARRAADAPPRRRRACRGRRRAQWSPEQAEALDQVGRWLQQGEPQVFRLFGYAGVGKTTLAKRTRRRRATGETAFAAFTGKAALVMRSKGCAGRDDHPRADLPRQRRRRRRADLHAQPRRPRLARRSDRDRRMLDGRRRTRRATSSRSASRSWCSAIPSQLPPVKGGGYFTEAEPDVMLTEIHRQARGQPDHPPVARSSAPAAKSPTANMARAASSAATRSTPPQVLAADQVLVGMNRTRRALQSAHPRSCSGIDGAAAGRRRQARLPAQRPRPRA